MGLFSKFKELNQQSKETDISKMKFQHYTGLMGAIPQNFADKSLPICPMCKKSSLWSLHVSQKIVTRFPVIKQENTYHIKCEHCGMIMHTVMHQIGNDTPHEMTKPSPRDNVTMMTIDVVGNQAENFELAGKEMSIWEINQLAEKK